MGNAGWQAYSNWWGSREAAHSLRARWPRQPAWIHVAAFASFFSCLRVKWPRNTAWICTITICAYVKSEVPLIWDGRATASAFGTRERGAEGTWVQAYLGSASGLLLQRRDWRWRGR